MKITNKAQMYKLYQQGLLGNRLQSWSSIEDYLASGFKGKVSLRYKIPGKPWSASHLNGFSVVFCHNVWVQEGADPDMFTVSESAPDDRLAIQGEIAQIDHLGYSLTYNTAKVNMREAMKAAKTHVGPAARTILKSYVDANSYDDIMELFDKYPGSVIEFSTYRQNLGIYPHRNTIIWEVRHY